MAYQMEPAMCMLVNVEKGVWRVEVSTGENLTARYLITALGLLSKQNYPDIKDIDTYKGEMHEVFATRASFPFYIADRKINEVSVSLVGEDQGP